MTTNGTQKESTSAGTEAPSGQRSGLDEEKCNTLFPTLQARVGHIRLKARFPGACISLEIPGPVTAQLLTLDEARQLIGALASLIGDIEIDLAARRRNFLEMIIAQADASSESYQSLP